MIRYLIGRLLVLIPVALIAASAVFFLLRLAPGDPVLALLGDKASQDTVEALRESWGFNDALVVQYVRFLGQLFTGDLGDSYTYQQPVIDLVKNRVAATMLLVVGSLLFAVAISLPLSLWAVLGKSRWAMRVSRLLLAVSQGVPTFLIGLILILIFGVKLGILPIAGYGTTAAEHLRALILPSLTIAIGVVPILAKSVMEALSEAVRSEYVSFALSKGLSRRRVITSYALRNASISGISILGIQVGNLMGGALVVENVFAIPGVGSLLMTSVTGRDLMVVQGLTIFFAVTVVIAYLCTDLLYAVVDPRMRTRS